MSVGSPAGTYNVGSPAFYRYVVRLAELGLPLVASEREAIELLAAIPNAMVDEDELAGRGWRVVPASSYEDWPVLEATPQRLRTALQTARRLLWQHAAPAGVTAREIVTIDEEIDKVLAVLQRAEAAGFSVNVSYVQ